MFSPLFPICVAHAGDLGAPSGHLKHLQLVARDQRLHNLPTRATLFSLVRGAAPYPQASRLALQSPAAWGWAVTSCHFQSRLQLRLSAISSHLFEALETTIEKKKKIKRKKFSTIVEK